ncbi:MAG: CRISPR-associated endoribonuclease Cas6 [Caldilineaceae bacterium]
MLTSLVLTLATDKTVRLPAHLGRANYSETLERLGQYDASLASELHDLEGAKPLTCSSLFGDIEYRDREALYRTGELYWLRVTGLTQRVSEAILAAFWQQKPSFWKLAGHPFQVVNAFCHPQRHPWSGSTTYEALAERHLLGQPTTKQMNEVTLEFASPTAFKSKELQVPLPLPNLVFGSLVDRWNRFSTVELSEQVRSFGELAVEVNVFDLRSVPVEQKNKSVRVGAMGSVRYRACYEDRYWLGLYQLLADFALYSGVGVQTATGMGQVRRIERT